MQYLPVAAANNKVPDSLIPKVIEPTIQALKKAGFDKQSQRRSECQTRWEPLRERIFLNSYASWRG